MKQASLFDDTDSAAVARSVGVPGSQPTLSKAQKLFNKLIARIESQRQRLRQWHDYIPIHQQRLTVELAPLHQRLREKRIEMVALLDRAMSGKALAKTQRAKVSDILFGLLTDLLSEARDAELERLYDKYSDVSFAEAQEEELDLAQSLASALFGVELDGGEGVRSAEELAQRIAEKMQESAAGRAEQPEAGTRGRKKGHKQSAKAAARAALREQAEQGASRALREAFRRLASALHPDREAGLEERARKTALMQQANQAYAARDLLALLELQLNLEQIDPSALADMADERLAHYNLVLEEQAQRLEEEIAEVSAPFVISLGGPSPRPSSPADVRRAVDDEVRELQSMLRSLEADLLSFQDIKALKSSLRHYRIEEPDDDLDPFESLLMAELQAGLRKR